MPRPVTLACVVCGAVRTGQVGPRCRACAGKARRTRPRPPVGEASYWQEHGPYWTRERIIAALRLYARRHDGVAPSVEEWKQARTPTPNYPGKVLSRPSTTTVRRVFGTWGAAVEAAGLPRRSTKYRGKKQARCRRGHPLTEPNVLYRKDGGRQCKRCVWERLEAKRRARGVPERPEQRKPRPWVQGTHG